ncbi:MAG: glutaredoxin domain-containing protein [Bermanella sp.]
MSNSNNVQGLALYHYRACPFCARTRQVLDKLNLNVEQRDILIEPKYRNELRQQGGSQQVPCLRIEKDNGKVQWLYESADIIRYFNTIKNQSSVNA